MKKKNVLVHGVCFAFIAGSSLSLLSCMDFFTSSWAPWARRDPASLIKNINTGNVHQYITDAEADAALSLEVLKGIKDALGNAGPGDAAFLEAAALKAATNAAGLGPALLNSLSDTGKISEAAEDPAKAKALIIDAIGKMSNLEETRNTLLEILPPPGTPEFTLFVAASDINALALAAAVLVSAEAHSHPGGAGNYVDSFTGSGGVSPAEKMAHALSLSAIQKYDNSGAEGIVKEILTQLGWAS
jgi:hypothetical protein